MWVDTGNARSSLMSESPIQLISKKKGAERSGLRRELRILLRVFPTQIKGVILGTGKHTS